MAKPTVAIYGIKDRNTFEYPAYVHDHNLCVMQDGEIVQYLQLERVTRRKYDNRLDLYVEDLIDKKIIDCPDDFDLVCVNDFVGNAFSSQNGRLRFEADYQNHLKFNAIPAHGYWQYSGWEGKPINSFWCSTKSPTSVPHCRFIVIFRTIRCWCRSMAGRLWAIIPPSFSATANLRSSKTIGRIWDLHQSFSMTIRLHSRCWEQNPVNIALCRAN